MNLLNYQQEQDDYLNIIKKKFSPIKIYLAQKLKELGIKYKENKVDINDQTELEAILNDQNEIQNMVKSIIEQFNDRQTLKNQIQELKQEFMIKQRVFEQFNQRFILSNFQTLLPLTETLSNLSKILQDGNYPLQLYKNFRKIYQYISLISNAMHTFKSRNEEFNKQKEQYINQQMALFQTIFAKPTPKSYNNGSQFNDDYSNSKIQSTNDKHKFTNQKQKSCYKQDLSYQKQTVDQLKNQILHLQQLLRENNDEFAEQVQKYNSILYEQQEQLKRCERQFRLFQAKIDQLESINIRFREQKFRDEIMIENMTKKLRAYQKQKGYLSPRGRMHSPNATVQASRYTQYYPKLRRQQYKYK